MTMPATATEFSVFLPFGKVDKQTDGTLMVHTVLNDETVDDQGEIVDFGAVEKASAAYMEWANVREQHQDDTAAGTMVSLTPDPVARTHEAILHVVDPVAVLKVETGVYKGSSLGGFKRRIRLQKSASGATVRRIMEIDWRETSLVDRPSRPKARLTLLKRSDGGDPPELIEETLMDDDLSKSSVTATEIAPAPEILPETAPEAGTDVYLGPDGKPLAKAAESVVDGTLTGDTFSASSPQGTLTGIPFGVSAAELTGTSTAPDISRETLEPLAKSAADDVRDAAWCLSSINDLINAEAAEGDTAGVAQLKTAQAALVAFIGAEAAEVGTPEDVAEEAAAAPVMAMASKSGDLGREAITAIVEEVLAKRAGAAPISEPPAAPDPEPTAQETSSEELLRKTTSYIDEQFSRYVSRPELEAMKGEVLGALTPMSEALAKIARFPAPGGPLRFAADADRFADEAESGPANEAEVLAKASRATSDPHLREELGRLAAAAQIAADRKATP